MIKEVAIQEIIPYENNPRKNEKAIEYVANSIREFGFKVPVVLDKNNVIVTGHTRYEAAKKLGLEKIPAIYADDLTEEQAKAFRLVDNKTAEFSGWDFEKLEKEIDGLFEIDMSQFGFENLEKKMDLEDFFGNEEQNEKKEKEDKKIQCPCCGGWFTK